MRFSTWGCLALVVSAAGWGHSVSADDEAASGTLRPGDRAAAALEVTRGVARSLRVSGGEGGGTELALVDAPLQRFSNPVVGEFYGHLFLWTEEGRPRAAASIQKWYAPSESLHLELQSLCEHPLTAERGGETVWHPEQAGVSFRPVPDAPAPAADAAPRLLQMRQAARRFGARVAAVNRPGDVDEALRLLGQPVYRYPGEEAARDGAVFCFVRGTDPELLLLIEAHPAEGGAGWRYAFAPMNSFEFHATCDGEEVWGVPQSAPPWANVRDPSKPYLLITGLAE